MNPANALAADCCTSVGSSATSSGLGDLTGTVSSGRAAAHPDDPVVSVLRCQRQRRQSGFMSSSGGADLGAQPRKLWASS
jgi:hypothetical protein